MRFLIILALQFFTLGNINPEHVPILQPLKQSDFKYISSPYGPRVDPFSGKATFHHGIDIVGNHPNVKVYATANGIVLKTGYSKVLGNYIILSHAYDFETKYGHLGEVFVAKDAEILAGQSIARVGDSGKSTGAHLHYELRYDGETIDPVAWREEWSTKLD